jgi:hypothetical protein
VLTIDKPVADSLDAQKKLLCLPGQLTKGIETSDDPMVEIQNGAYAVSFSRRAPEHWAEPRLFEALPQGRSNPNVPLSAIEPSPQPAGSRFAVKIKENKITSRVILFNRTGSRSRIARG